jgi:hypothetical protein
MEPMPSKTHNGNVSPMCVVVINSINGEKKERKISLTTPTKREVEISLEPLILD